jgi:peptidoglycan/LPS O-acetylase OafA/YrhL
MPGLDGLRAVAVLGVLAYHLGADWIPGGLLGVGVFFTLSGYLITDILLAQVDKGGIKLGQFWLARARRLLPAVILLLIVVMAWVTVIGPHQPSDFRWATGSALGYVNNWWLIFHDVSYFEQFGAPEPLNHLWSLSIEEQFYILWPFMVILGVRFVPEVANRMGVRPRLALVALGLAVVSAVLMVVLYDPGIDPSRVYYGTDTRAQELLVGAALAMVWPSRRLRTDINPSAKRTLEAQGWIGLAVIGLMFWRCGEFSPFLYRGGFLLLSISTAMLVAALAHPALRIGPILGCAPMRWIGERSYGIYLWHFPIIILTTPEGAEIGGSLPRALAQLAATFAIAALSWKYMENPIRHGGLKRLRGPQRVTREAWVGIGVATLVVAAALAGMAGVGAGPSRADAPGNLTVATTLESGDVADADDANRTSCNTGTHIGDSTSEGLISPDYLPNVKQQIPATYGRAGIEQLNVEISGARSIYETFEGEPNAESVALSWKDQGFDGCWVFALGTNEAANVAAGSNVGFDERIDTMMDAVDGDPALWVNVRTLVGDGPYAETNMAAWNKALLAACAEYPNMRIYDWATDVRDNWFVEDGIHFTTPGYAARSRLIASALLESFPATGEVMRTPDQSCVIHPTGVLPEPPRSDSKDSGVSAGA